MRNAGLFILLAAVVLVAGVFWYRESTAPAPQEPLNALPDTSTTQTSRPLGTKPVVVASKLDTPWEIAFLPDGQILVTERPGVLRLISSIPTLPIPVPDVLETEEGGLMGLAIHPNFATNQFIYLYFTTKNEGRTINRVVRYKLEGQELLEPQTIVDNIPAGGFHNGGRIIFGPDSLLYITTGDAGNESDAQNKESLAGKILRVTDTGETPEDNPFGNRVYSYGHRNPQGLAFDDKGGLWATEHGRSGVQSGLDEINYIEKGGNYGWPEIEGDEVKAGMKTPAINSGPDKTWAPAGLVFRDGKLYFAGLRGRALYEVPILENGKLGTTTELFYNQLGRLRAVSLSAEGTLYFGTSNQDGRGYPTTTDDRVFSL